MNAIAASRQNATIVDFRRSLPPVPENLHAHFASALAALTQSQDLGELTHQSVPRGTEEDRMAAARWLETRFGQRLAPSRIMLTNGTQSAISILLRRIVGADGLLIAERLSYGPLRLLADLAGVHVAGVALDDEGILPDAFEEACHTLKPKALYCNPTVHNPTTSIMPEERRIAIGDIARRYGVAIIEDDALGLLHPDAPRPIASVAPDLTWYVMTTTKCLSHGLRLAHLIAPSAQHANRVIGPVEHLSYWHPAPLLAAMTAHWINNGAAEEISRAIREECIARERAARQILAGFDLRSEAGSMHIWLNLPRNCSGKEFMKTAERRGVLLRSSELFAVDDQRAPNAARLSLSTPQTLDGVRQGLETVRAILGGL